MNNIILFATYWNEIEWIEESLYQILKIDPVEIIICDGNFDSRVDNFSTDGTREQIKKFINQESHRATMISAERVANPLRGINFFCGSGRGSSRISLSRLNYALRSQFIFNEYRVNQALTFSKMIKMSEKWQPGRWVMSYDADQFYTDEVIEKFEVVNSETDIQLLTANERTFPYSFNEYTTNYESRIHNNMPHKIMRNMSVYPTRHFVVESRLSYKHYYQFAKTLHCGIYHHYKFRKDSERLAAGYKLGDRQPPCENRYRELKLFHGKHPEAIRRKISGE